jgi:hypothetical protein
VICWSNAASVLNTADGSVLREVHAPFGNLDWAWFSPDGTRLVTTPSFEGEVMQWDLETTSEPQTISSGGHKWGGAAFDPSGERIAGARMDGTVVIWHADGGGSPTLDEPRQDGINHIADVSSHPTARRSSRRSTTPRVWTARRWGPDPSADTPREDSVQSNASAGTVSESTGDEDLGSPGMTLRRVVRAAREANSDVIRKHLSQTCRADLPQEREADGDCWTEFFDVFGRARWSDVRIAGSGKRAKARISLEQRGEKPKRGWIRFVMEDGRWTIDRQATKEVSRLGERCGTCPFSMLPPNSEERMMMGIDL